MSIFAESLNNGASLKCINWPHFNDVLSNQKDSQNGVDCPSFETAADADLNPGPLDGQSGNLTAVPLVNTLHAPILINRPFLYVLHLSTRVYQMLTLVGYVPDCQGQHFQM